MKTIHKLHISLAELTMRVREGGGDVRMWRTLGGVGFLYIDRGGHCIAGWEEITHRGVCCVVYHGSKPSSGPVPAPRKPTREVREEEEEGESQSHFAAAIAVSQGDDYAYEGPRRRGHEGEDFARGT